jgi:hypothetical protein
MEVLDDHRTVAPELAALLRRLSKGLVVIGLVARGDKLPNDLDVWINVDGFVGGEPRLDAVRRVIAESGLEYDSPFPTCWSFPSRLYPGVMVELIGCPNVPASFTRVRRSARQSRVFGVELPVALPEHAGTATKGGRAISS